MYFGGAMAQAVICQPFRAEAQVQSQASLHNIFGGQLVVGVFFSNTAIFHYASSSKQIL
jgi:hypothetical protein